MYFGYSQASLLLDGMPSCGASIIDRRNLLTTARCVTEFGNVIDLSRLTAVIGSLTFLGNDEPQAETRQIREVFIHESYNWMNNMNDIAVLRVYDRKTTEKLYNCSLNILFGPFLDRSSDV